MSLLTEITARLKITHTGANDFGQDVFKPVMEKLLTLTDGTAADKADLAWFDQRTVNSGANDDIDLAGVLADAFGATLTMAELVALFVINGPISGAANTTALTIGGGSAPVTGFLGGTTPTIGPIQPGGFVFLAAGHASGLGTVTATSADILRIANAAGAAATYRIGIIGRSA